MVRFIIRIEEKKKDTCSARDKPTIDRSVCQIPKEKGIKHLCIKCGNRWCYI